MKVKLYDGTIKESKVILLEREELLQQVSLYLEKQIGEKVHVDLDVDGQQFLIETHNNSEAVIEKLEELGYTPHTPAEDLIPLIESIIEGEKVKDTFYYEANNQVVIVLE